MASTWLRRSVGFLALAGLVVISTAVALLAGELFVRWIDGYPLTALRLPDPPASPGRTGDLTAFAHHFAAVARDPSVPLDWYSQSPPAPARREPDPALAVRYAAHGANGLNSIYVWNRRFVQEETCREKGHFLGLKDAWTYEPLRDTPFPRYRFPADKTLPTGMTTNAYGWRSPAVALQKEARTVRIAFVGASTTVNAHADPYSYPDHVRFWLEQWTRIERPDLRFEVLNTAREGTNSNDFAAIVRDELALFDPDLVVYYEGSNQFWPVDFVDWPEGRMPRRPRQTLRRLKLGLTAYSAIVRRIEHALPALRGWQGSEPPKQFGRVNWPADLDEQQPDPHYPRLPVNLNTILRDMDAIRDALAGRGGQLILSSFVWLVEDNLVLDANRHRYIYQQLNEMFWPFPYRHMRRMADFQNRVFRAYANRHRLDFLDVAAVYPLDPNLFDDAIHMNPAGTRLHAWIVFNQLVPVLKRKLAAGELPRAPHPAPLAHPAFAEAPRLVRIADIAAGCARQ